MHIKIITHNYNNTWSLTLALKYISGRVMAFIDRAVKIN